MSMHQQGFGRNEEPVPLTAHTPISRVIWHRITTLRNERGWSVYRLAQESGIPAATLISIDLRGTVPKLPTLEHIAECFGMSLAQLLLPDTDTSNDLVYLWIQLTPEQQVQVIAYTKRYAKRLARIIGQD